MCNKEFSTISIRLFPVKFPYLSANLYSKVSIDKIFDRFYREELSRSREKGGAGIGLSICAAIVEAHSGLITAKSSSLGGLLIEIQLNKN